MAKILHSHKIITYFVNQKNKTNYLKNGGGHMANTKICAGEKENFFNDVVSFLKNEEEKEKLCEKKNEPQTKQKENKDYSFEETLLSEQLCDALNEFNIKKANKIKQKLSEIQNANYEGKENKQEEFVKSLMHLKEKPLTDMTSELLNIMQDENSSRLLANFLIGVIKND